MKTYNLDHEAIIGGVRTNIRILRNVSTVVSALMIYMFDVYSRRKSWRLEFNIACEFAGNWFAFRSQPIDSQRAQNASFCKIMIT